jgi:hypothetical protein
MAKLTGVNIAIDVEEIELDDRSYVRTDADPKAGDIVRVDRLVEGWMWADLTVGAFYAVEEEDDERGPFFRDEAGDKRGFNGNHECSAVREAVAVFTPEPVVPKVGDYVRITKNQNAARVGAVVKVNAVRPKMRGQALPTVEYTWTTPDGLQIDRWVSDAYEVVPAPAPVAPPKRPFKVGDKVVLTATKARCGFGSRVKTGDIGVVAEILSSKAFPGKLRVDFPEHKRWNGYDEEFRLAMPADEYAASWAKLGRKPHEYKAGDIVKVTCAGAEHIAGIPVGTITEIVRAEGCGVRVAAKNLSGSNAWFVADSGVQLVTPVEQRLDK